MSVLKWHYLSEIRNFACQSDIWMASWDDRASPKKQPFTVSYFTICHNYVAARKQKSFWAVERLGE